MNSNENKSSEKQENSKKGSTVVGVLSASVLAYCGYKIVKNQLQKSKYEPDPNKKCTK